MTQRPLSAAGAVAPDAAAHIVLDGSRLNLTTLEPLLSRRLNVVIADEVWSRVAAGEAAVKQITKSHTAAYGINTGFGVLCGKRIPDDQLRTLQSNLILSHAVGMGPPAPPEIVRWMLLFKIHALSHGYSGISRATVERLATLLNADLLPVVPTQGSLGASGDLAPLAHMVLPLLGLGQVQAGERTLTGTEALRQLGTSPALLGPKEGLALINGTQFMCAYAAAIAVRGRRLMKNADIVAAMALEACAGSAKPFDQRLNALRPHPGAIECAANIRALLQESEILPSHVDCDRVQDPYSLRCVPQVHGACRDAWRHAAETVETEINSVTDNPLILQDGEVISGGLFHGEPLALALDYMAIALAELASISERRTYLLLSGIGGLPLLLMRETGINSGFMLPQYTAAALVSENKGLCTPASVDSIPTSLGQEDHVSMGARAACKCWQVLDNAEKVLAIEMFSAAQGLDFRLPLRAGAGPRAAHEFVREHVPFADRDRLFSPDLAEAHRLLATGEVLKAAEAAVGPLY